MQSLAVQLSVTKTVTLSSSVSFTQGLLKQGLCQLCMVMTSMEFYLFSLVWVALGHSGIKKVKWKGAFSVSDWLISTFLWQLVFEGMDMTDWFQHFCDSWYLKAWTWLTDFNISVTAGIWRHGHDWLISTFLWLLVFEGMDMTDWFQHFCDSWYLKAWTWLTDFNISVTAGIWRHGHDWLISTFLWQLVFEGMDMTDWFQHFCDSWYLKAWTWLTDFNISVTTGIWRHGHDWLISTFLWQLVFEGMDMTDWFQHFCDSWYLKAWTWLTDFNISVTTGIWRHGHDWLISTFLWQLVFEGMDMTDWFQHFCDSWYLKAWTWLTDFNISVTAGIWRHGHDWLISTFLWQLVFEGMDMTDWFQHFCDYWYLKAWTWLTDFNISVTAGIWRHGHDWLISTFLWQLVFEGMDMTDWFQHFCDSWYLKAWTWLPDFNISVTAGIWRHGHDWLISTFLWQLVFEGMDMTDWFQHFCDSWYLKAWTWLTDFNISVTAGIWRHGHDWLISTFLWQLVFEGMDMTDWFQHFCDYWYLKAWTWLTDFNISVTAGIWRHGHDWLISTFLWQLVFEGMDMTDWFQHFCDYWYLKAWTWLTDFNISVTAGIWRHGHDWLISTFLWQLVFEGMDMTDWFQHFCDSWYLKAWTWLTDFNISVTAGIWRHGHDWLISTFLWLLVFEGMDMTDWFQHFCDSWYLKAWTWLTDFNISVTAGIWRHGHDWLISTFLWQLVFEGMDMTDWFQHFCDYWYLKAWTWLTDFNISVTTGIWRHGHDWLISTFLWQLVFEGMDMTDWFQHFCDSWYLKAWTWLTDFNISVTAGIWRHGHDWLISTFLWQLVFEGMDMTDWFQHFCDSWYLKAWTWLTDFNISVTTGIWRHGHDWLISTFLWQLVFEGMDMTDWFQHFCDSWYLKAWTWLTDFNISVTAGIWRHGHDWLISTFLWLLVFEGMDMTDWFQHFCDSWYLKAWTWLTDFNISVTAGIWRHGHDWLISTFLWLLVFEGMDKITKKLLQVFLSCTQITHTSFEVWWHGLTLLLPFLQRWHVAAHVVG